jgi:hypothetical protein
MAETNGALTATTGTFTNGLTVNSGQTLFPNGSTAIPAIAPALYPTTGLSFDSSSVAVGMIYSYLGNPKITFYNIGSIKLTTGQAIGVDPTGGSGGN